MGLRFRTAIYHASRSTCANHHRSNYAQITLEADGQVHESKSMHSHPSQREDLQLSPSLRSHRSHLKPVNAEPARQRSLSHPRGTFLSTYQQILLPLIHLRASVDHPRAAYRKLELMKALPLLGHTAAAPSDRALTRLALPLSQVTLTLSYRTEVNLR